MRTIESLAVAASMRDRKLQERSAAQEFQTTIVGMLGHDLRQSLHVIQGTYALLRSRMEEMPQQAWLDRGERAATKLTEQLNCLVDAFYLAEHDNALEAILCRTWAAVLAASTRKRRRRSSKGHRPSSDFNECLCREQSCAARLHTPQSDDQRHKIYGAWRAHPDRLPPQGARDQDRRIRHGHRHSGRPIAANLRILYAPCARTRQRFGHRAFHRSSCARGAWPPDRSPIGRRRRVAFLDLRARC